MGSWQVTFVSSWSLDASTASWLRFGLGSMAESQQTSQCSNIDETTSSNYTYWIGVGKLPWSPNWMNVAHFSTVKCTLSQNLVNYDTWYTSGPFRQFYYQKSFLAKTPSPLKGLNPLPVEGVFVHFSPVKCALSQNLVNKGTWYTSGPFWYLSLLKGFKPLPIEGLFVQFSLVKCTLSKLYN